MIQEIRKKNAVLLLLIFYIAVGIVEIGYFLIENFTAPIHVLFLGILSIITAYSHIKIKKWIVPMTVVLFLMVITFGVVTLSTSLSVQSFEAGLLFNTILIVYMAMLFIPD